MPIVQIALMGLLNQGERLINLAAHGIDEAEGRLWVGAIPRIASLSAS